MGTYFTSDGERVSQDELTDRIIAAKQKKKDDFKYEHNDWFCEDCGANEYSGPIDMSHDISVQKCKDSRQVELAYDVNNITLRCRNCHRKHDSLSLHFGGG